MQISESPDNKIQITFDDEEFNLVRSACKLFYFLEEERSQPDEKVIKGLEKILDAMNRV